MQGNAVTVIGNLVKDPEVAHSANGTAYARFSIGRSFRTRDDEQRSEFYDGVIFGDQAEHVAATLKKGARVIVNAHLRQSKWETADGQRRQRVELVVEEIGPSLRWATGVIEKVPAPSKTESEPEAEQQELVSVGASDEEPF